VNIETFAVSGSQVGGLGTTTGQGLVCGGFTTDQVFDEQAEKSVKKVSESCGSCIDPPDGLVSWWPGDSNVLDIKGANDGQFVFGTLGNLDVKKAYDYGMVGRGFKLDGIDDHVFVKDSESLDIGKLDSFTVDAWIKTKSVKDQVVFGKQKYALGVAEGKLQFELRDNEGKISVVTSEILVNDDVLHHVAGVRDVSKRKLFIYIDGVEAGSADDLTGSLVNDADFLVGLLFEGIVDEAQFFRRALSQAEINAEFKAGRFGKCKPDCYSTGFTVSQLDMRLVQSASGKVSKQQGFEAATTIGQPIRVSLTDSSVPVSIGISNPDKPVQVPNPEMRVVTAFVVSMDDVKSGIELRVPVPAQDSSAGLYLQAGGVWIQLDGARDKNVLVVRLSGEQVSQYFESRGAKIYALFAVLSLKEAVADKFMKLYDGGGSHAVVFVQGITTNSVSIKKFVHEYSMAQDDAKVYAYSYTPSKPLSVLSKDFAQQASSVLLQDGVREVFIVPYSFGGLVVQDALAHSKENNLALAGMTKDVVYIGTPFGGSPLLEVWDRFFSYVLNTRIAAGLFNVPSVHKDVLDALVNGRQEDSPSVDADYGLVIGTRSYPFTSQFFEKVNDGVIEAPDAVPKWFVEESDCDPNVLRVDVTHDQLPGAWPVRDFVYKLANKDKAISNPDAPVLGYSQSVDISQGSCSSGDRVVIVGDRVSDNARPRQCSCGDGVCGVGENFRTCPQDCATAWQRFNLCLFLPWIINALLMLVLVSSVVYIYRKEKTHERGRGFNVFFVSLVITSSAIAVHFMKCEFLLPLALLLTLLILLLLITALVHFKTPKGYIPPPPAPKRISKPARIPVTKGSLFDELDALRDRLKRRR
jgi:hypothetical protein